MTTLLRGASAAVNGVAQAPERLIASITHLASIEQQEAKRERVSSVRWWKDVGRIKGSAITKVWSSVLIITLWSCVVAIGRFTYDAPLGLTNNVVPLLSVVVGLLLVFRQTSSFSRWEDGRKTFTAMTANIRSLVRYIHLNAGSAPYDAERKTEQGSPSPFRHARWTERDDKEKRALIRMFAAFPVSVMHHVRGEYGTGFDDLTDLLPPGFHRLRTHDYGSLENELRSARSMPDIGSRAQPDPERAHHFLSHSDSSAEFLENEFARPSLPLPLQIVHQIALVLARWKAHGFLDTGYNTLHQGLSALVTEFGATERLGSMAIPSIYGIHRMQALHDQRLTPAVKQVVSLFLLLLPFTLVDQLQWRMIPFVTAYAFILVGIEGIATETQQPFGRDGSDLPLDLICAELRNEIEHVLANLPSDPAAIGSLLDD